MMNFVNTTINLQQVNITSNSTEHGSFSALSHQLLLDIRTRYNAESTGSITLNCSGLESINSHGINLLIMLLMYSRRQQKRLLFFGLSEHNRYILQITRLNQFFDIADTTTRAGSVVHTT